MNNGMGCSNSIPITGTIIGTETNGMETTFAYALAPLAAPTESKPTAVSVSASVEAK